MPYIKKHAPFSGSPRLALYLTTVIYQAIPNAIGMVCVITMGHHVALVRKVQDIRRKRLCFPNMDHQWKV